MNDLKFAFRQLLKNPGFTAVAVLTLALGIGANTAVFSVANEVLLNPVPGRDNKRLITVSEVNVMSGFHWHVSPPLFQELASHVNLVEALTYFAQAPEEKKIQADEKTVKLRGAKVAPNFFASLGIRPLAGRTFLPHEGAEASNAIIISHGLWQQPFGGAADRIGKSIELDGKAYTVVGIMPPNIQFPFGQGNSQFWIPYVFSTDELSRSWEPEEGVWLVIGRLRKGITMQRLQGVLDTLAARWQRDNPQPNQRWKFQVDRWLGYSPTLEKTLWSLQAMFGALLAIACANVGNLLLSRALSRRGEFGIRMAIGARPLRIVRQLLVESLSLAGLAAVPGVFFAWGGIIALDQFYLSGLPRINAIGVDWRVLGTTCLMSAVAGVFFGAAPAWLAARVNVNEALKETAQQHSGGFLQRIFRDGLVVVQISFAVVLLAAAGMMIQSVVKLLRVDPGLNPKGLYSVLYDPNPVMKSKFDLEAAMRGGLSRKEAITEAYRWKVRLLFNWQELILEGLQAIPGIESAAVKAEPGGGYGCQVEGRTGAGHGQRAYGRLFSHRWCSACCRKIADQGRLPARRTDSRHQRAAGLRMLARTKSPRQKAQATLSSPRHRVRAGMRRGWGCQEHQGLFEGSGGQAGVL